MGETNNAAQKDERRACQPEQPSWGRRLITCSSIGWFFFCCLVAFSLIGFGHWSLVLISLTPLPSLLVPVSLGWSLLVLALHRRALPWALAALIPAFVLTPYETGPWRITLPDRGPRDESEETADLKILSANAGKRDRDELLNYIESLSPDLIAVQAARLPESAPWLHDWHVSKVARLSLWSRWPILESEPLELSGEVFEAFEVFGAKFQVAWPQEPLSVYVIHFPSPRESLGALTPATFLTRETGQRLREYEQRRLAAWGLLAMRVAVESGPTIVVGDANQPAIGPGYRKLVGSLRDGHRRAGWGFGFTLQDVVNTHFTSPPYAWARIDYILANSHLEFLHHRTEPPHPGQHRALFARVRRLAPPSAE